MRIAFFVSSLYRGGAERVLVNIAEQFHDAGHKVIFITQHRRENEYNLNEAIERINIDDLEKCNNRFFRVFERIGILRKIYKREGIDIVISFLCIEYAIMSTLFLKTKSVISIRNNPRNIYNTRMKRLVARFILPLADWCVFQTVDAKKWFHKSLQAKSDIIFNPIRKEFFLTKRQNTPNQKIVVTCGRLEKQKNYSLLIDAFKDISSLYSNCILKIYGMGSQYDALLNMINQRGLEKKVFLMGNTEDVPAALAEGTMFVMSSNFEGMPNALMEAMAVGLPCISTKCPCGGPEELLKEEVGILIDVNNKRQLVESMEKIILDDGIANNYSIRAKQKSKEFSSEKIFIKWEKIIFRLLNVNNKWL